MELIRIIKSILWPRYKFVIDFLGIYFILYLISIFKYGYGKVPDILLLIDAAIVYAYVLLTSLGDIYGEIHKLRKEKDEEDNQEN